MITPCPEWDERVRAYAHEGLGDDEVACHVSGCHRCSRFCFEDWSQYGAQVYDATYIEDVLSNTAERLTRALILNGRTVLPPLPES